MPPRIIVRRNLEFPRMESASPALLRMISRLENAAEQARPAIQSLRHADGVFLPDIPWRRYLHELRHPLSKEWSQKGGGRVREPRDEAAEFVRFKSAARPMTIALNAPNELVFGEYLVRAAKLLCGDELLRFRNCQVGAWPDADGTQVIFCDANLVPERLAELYQQLCMVRLPTATRAVAAMAVLLNIHPFPDGNGRCARTLFGAVLSRAWDMPHCYIPLRTILELSEGGYEMRIREAETNGNWAPLIQYFTTIFVAIRLGVERLTAPMPF